MQICVQLYILDARPRSLSERATRETLSPNTLVANSGAEPLIALPRRARCSVLGLRRSGDLGLWGLGSSAGGVEFRA